MQAPATASAPRFEVQPGDIYNLGTKHRLMCGDAASKEDVDRLLDGKKPTVVISSPPYLNLRDYHNPISCWTSLVVAAFDMPFYAPDCQILINLGVIHRKGEIVCYWNSFIDEMKTRGWKHAGMYVWDKLQAIPGANIGTPRPAHEFVFHLRKIKTSINDTEPNKDAGKRNWGYKFRDADGTLRVKSIDRKVIKPAKPIDSVLRIRAAKHNRTEHPAVFPVSLPQKLISAYAQNDTKVYDPFCGSGTTILAAELENVTGLGMEISPAYTAIALERWAKAYPDQPITKAVSAPCA